MSTKDKRSFFERLTGTVRVEDDFDDAPAEVHHSTPAKSAKPMKQRLEVKERDPEPLPATEWANEPEDEERELSVDVYQTPQDIYIRTMVAGVDPNDLDIAITRDMVTLKGRREVMHEVEDDNYFYRELYWGTFSRTIALPEEINVEEAEASQKHGLLTIKLPKVDKSRQTKLKVKSI